ncbi:MAG TPA: hypothetical protein VHB79_20750 [Polyangiaceae bacterium]|nr:hypothetical protein [Polyangiaceae bacterium]
MTIPKTPLSFMYHTLIKLYRDEVHATPDVSFARFNITSASLQKACLDADKAAETLRQTPTSQQAQADLEAASKVIFADLVPFLAAEVSQGVAKSDQPMDDGKGVGNGVVASVYRLVYSKEFRDTDPAAPDASIKTEWDAFKAALVAGQGDFKALFEHATGLCNRMMADANGNGWMMWW